MYPHHSAHSDILFDITDSLLLGLSYPTNPVSTRVSDNDQNLHSVINLMFFRYRLVDLDNYTIHLEQRLLLDHAFLIVTNLIEEQHANNCKHSIGKGSKKEKSFIKDLIKYISSIDIFNLSDTKSLENIIDLLTCIAERAWDKNSKIINISKHSKSQQDTSCSKDLEKYRLTRNMTN